MPQASLLPAASRALLPDPILSASVYCSGRLCEVIQRLVSPFWAEYRGTSSDPSAYLWVMRYARGGEHLKIRLHGEGSEAQLLRDLLAAAQAAYFARLAGEPPARQAAKGRPDAPPIDVEDRVDRDHPDRTFLWTAYRRSPLSLGVEPFLQDDGYLELLTRCLGCGTEILLARLEAGQDGDCPHPLRRDLLLSGLLFGLAQLRLSDRERALYLLYHRDTLLRHLRKRKNWSASTEVMARVLAHLDLQAERDPRREELRRSVSQHGTAGHAWRWQADISAWCGALRELEDYVTPWLGDPSSHVDPFAERPLFPLLFKVFHGFANQIGLDAVNEAFLLHLLAGVTAEPDLLRRPVRLRPDFRAQEEDAAAYRGEVRT
ncbi:MAG TPA: lantibiotic dehydratase C-terminal domain-containing protein [Thermoanaerobaculia bacterium]